MSRHVAAVVWQQYKMLGCQSMILEIIIRVKQSYSGEEDWCVNQKGMRMVIANSLATCRSMMMET